MAAAPHVRKQSTVNSVQTGISDILNMKLLKMMGRRIVMLGLCSLMSVTAVWAQMTFQLNGLVFGDVAQRDEKGFTTVTVPFGTDLEGLVSGVEVDGVAVDAALVKPNPVSTQWRYDELRVFSYRNKVYGFRFVEDPWFTAVIVSDCHINQGSGHDGTSTAEMKRIMQSIIAMGKNGTKKVKFTNAPDLVPKTSIIFCLGDIDQDKGDDGSIGTHKNFLGCTADVAKSAGVPFIFIGGNHDISPDFWTGNNPDRGATFSGSNADDETISAVVANNDYWNASGVFDENIEYIVDSSKPDCFQSKPFTFRFKGVRFYCAHTYWFQKLYERPGWFSNATYYAPDGVIAALDAYVEKHKDEASVWMQHFPWLAASDCNRWWLDQNDKGLYIPTTDESRYGCHQEGIAYNDAKTANQMKKDPLAAIMVKAAGLKDGQVQHFSGHYHRYSNRVYTSTTDKQNKVHDYTVAAPGNSEQTNNSYVVLMKRGEGVVEVKQAKF